MAMAWSAIRVLTSRRGWRWSEAGIYSVRGFAGEPNREASGGEEGDVRERILDAAVSKVPELGWTEQAIREGAIACELSPAAIGVVRRGEVEMVEHFIDRANGEFEREAKARQEELSGMEINERLKELVKMRLRYIQPHAHTWARALALQLGPRGLDKALSQRARISDEVWHIAGDKSTDSRWYLRRGLLASVYTAGEVAMATDGSQWFEETDRFVERRVDDVVDFDSRVSGQLGVAWSGLDWFGRSVVSFLARGRFGG